jgi:cystathionine gamma-synthase
MSDDPATRIVHAGRDRSPRSPSAPPIVAASFFTSAGDPGEAGYAYARDGNPTWEVLEAALGALEDARALVFASGQAAMLSLALALTRERPRIVLPADGYYGTRKLLGMLASRGVEPVAVDLGDAGAVRRALEARPASLLAETPTNPLLRVFDLERLGALAAAADASMVVDNTVATGVLQKPLEWGALASVYSLTKGASGHSDLVLGAVVTRDEVFLGRLAELRSATGGIAGPFEAWLAHRGLMTLPVRIARQSESALELARRLAEHPRIERVHYPPLDRSTAAVAERQMRGGFGPLLSFEVGGGAEAADRVVTAARVIRPATSLGGVESTWERRARWASETSAAPGLIRLSVGLEGVEDLWQDVEQALAAGAGGRASGAPRPETP